MQVYRYDNEQDALDALDSANERAGIPIGPNAVTRTVTEVQTGVDDDTDENVWFIHPCDKTSFLGETSSLTLKDEGP